MKILLLGRVPAWQSGEPGLCYGPAMGF